MLQKNLHPFSERLLRFMNSRFVTKTAFAAELGMTPQALGTVYLKSEPFPGSLLFHKLNLLGCDLNWLMTGFGRAPEPVSKEEADVWIAYCEKQVRYWQARIEMEQQFAKEQAVLYDAQMKKRQTGQGRTNK